MQPVRTVPYAFGIYIGREIDYNSNEDTFTVLDSRSMTNESLREIFAKRSYQGQSPIVLDERDGNGNLQVSLKSARVGVPHQELSMFYAPPVNVFDMPAL